MVNLSTHLCLYLHIMSETSLKNFLEKETAEARLTQHQFDSV